MSLSTTASSTSTSLSCKPRGWSRNALKMSVRKSSLLSGANKISWQRLSNAPFTSNPGFSVVAPMSVTVPSSTAPRSASCCPLLKRWISSMKSIVSMNAFFICRASARTSLTSFTPLATAESATKRFLVCCLMTWARLVFPQPGGPQKIMLGMESFSRLLRNRLCCPRILFCPRNSSRFCGRRRSAKGASMVILYKN